LFDHLIAGAGRPAPAIHYTSHSSLLRRCRPGRRLGLDAIVVSAARPAGNLLPALRLGAALDAPVVLMCSQDTVGDHAAAKVASVSGVKGFVVDMSKRPDVDLPDLETSRFPEARVGSHGDLSRKRNIGLVLGRLAGWRTMLFLDDDIVGLEPVRVKRAVAALGHNAAVGMPAQCFPDNSVVCHARRVADHLAPPLGGQEQGVFVSGSALAVNLQRVDSFFPDIYNEDWLFLAPHLDRRDVASFGSVVQLAYDPFELPYRAAAQEFGDVLAEGLVGFLHSARLHRPPPIDYWEAFLLQGRAAFISLAMQVCQAALVVDARAARALKALRIAAQVRSTITAAALAEYVDAWIHDLAVWRRFLGELPRLGNLPASISHLELPAVTIPSRSRSPARRQSTLFPKPAPPRRLCTE
jgi:hypothetical protein